MFAKLKIGTFYITLTLYDFYHINIIRRNSTKYYQHGVYYYGQKLCK